MSSSSLPSFIKNRAVLEKKLKLRKVNWRQTEGDVWTEGRRKTRYDKGNMTSKRRQNVSTIWLWNGTKNNNTFYIQLYASRSILCIGCVAVAFWSEERDPVTYFCPILNPPLGRSGPNALKSALGHEFFNPTKFCKHPLRLTICSHNACIFKTCIN